MQVKQKNGKETVYPITAPDGFFTFWFDDDTSVNDNLNFGESKVYPNPMVNEATLEINSEVATTAKVSLYDLVGVKIADLGTVSLAAGINKMEFVAPDLTNGMYLLRIDSAEATTMLKISIAK